MREYPAFIIDRSRRSAASRFTDDFVVCTDREVGFIARVYKLPKSRRIEFAQTWLANPAKYSIKVLGEAVVVLEIIHFLHEPMAHKKRVQPLMKKALKAYLFGECQEIAGVGKDFDRQLSAIKDVIRIAHSQRERLDDMNGVEASQNFIDSLVAAAESLQLLKKIIRHE